MTVAAAEQARSERVSFGPWLWGPRLDLALFGGSALAALSLVAIGRALGWSPGALPEWGWLGLIVAIDVAHVWSTLFRTYFDRDELRARKLRYLGVPLFAYALGVALHLHGSLTFWRVLAYAALFHFVRQQAGWVAVYRARAGQRSRFDRALDDAAIYVATLYPVLHWHARIGETEFAWFVRGDFVDLSELAGRLLPAARGAWVMLLLAFGLRQVLLWKRTGVVQAGKILVVASTAAVWWVGIVATNDDFDFTVTNVIVHGVPYFGLLWAYARERTKDAPGALGSRIVAGGVAAFVGVLLLLAFAEEMAWDRLVWHERGWLFGSGGTQLGDTLLALVVPLLALPQATHYLLDGVLWRSADTRRLRAQRAALGFRG
jgi:hypothetical protein